MKRFFAPLALLLSAFSTNVMAFSGGPFDNGFQSAALERNSIYQATLNFTNGSGFAYFSPTAQLVSPDPTTVTGLDSRGSIRNRVVLYYKGISYVGSAFGEVDAEARNVQCTFNASSELSYQATQQSQQSNLFTFAQTSSSVATNIVSSNRSYTVNGNFQAKVTQTAPTFRFKGTGEVAFLSPNGKDSVAGVAFNGYSGLINAIVTAVGNATVGANFSAAVFQQAQAAINSALADLPTQLSGAGIDVTFRNAQVHHLSVVGTRRYL